MRYRDKRERLSSLRSIMTQLFSSCFWFQRSSLAAFRCNAKGALLQVYDIRPSKYTIMLLQQTVTEPNEAFQKQFDCGQFPVVDVVVGLPGCHSPQQLVKCA